MINVTTTWLTQNVGKPSGKIGSKYTEIFDWTKKFEFASGETRFKIALKLIEKLGECSYSRHTGATLPSEKNEKERQQKLLNDFNVS